MAPKAIFRTWIAVAIGGVVVLGGAELLYRARFRSRLAALHRSLESAHDGRATFLRFGNETEDLHASLTADLMAWIQRRRGRPSALDGDDWRFTHAYAGLVFTADRWTAHVFYWSPRRQDFYHAANYGMDPCAGRDCDWAYDPALAGFRRPPSRPD